MYGDDRDILFNLVSEKKGTKFESVLDVMNKSSKTKEFKIKKTEKLYSQQFEEYYNNKKYSDLIIKFEKSGNTIYSHKFILSNSSTVLSDLINEVENEITIDSQEDEESFKIFIQFLYSGKVETTYLAPTLYYINKVTSFFLKKNS
jgi:hypothetical protein